MKDWNFIEIDDGVDKGGFTDDGYEITEMTISGWNDDEEFSDAETLVTVTAIEKENQVEVHVKYHFEDIKFNNIVKELVAEIKEEILTQI